MGNKLFGAAERLTENSFNFDLNEIDNFYTGFFHNGWSIFVVISKYI